eukprot:gnl/TRDRNA2_/TRDRNA2_198387_c0_seq1.p2 gnl/TRDRNA2_/TRDRNA2_198387_c0~~gnl/TRDRNA2_/TRDRNA2_198387_c0_seq1.p2  ORF type:complete len:108 (+),score=4.16 gnl/TRDRNA2_/TRDRNA2_198387_c0_seq1:377-700(+)
MAKTFWFCHFPCRVLQGCPLSGTLFIIVLNPFLYLLNTILSGPRVIARAFADDIAAIRESLPQLKPVSSSAKCFAVVSGLEMEPEKCIPILIDYLFDSDFLALVRNV